MSSSSSCENMNQGWCENIITCSEHNLANSISSSNQASCNLASSIAFYRHIHYIN